MLIKSQVSEKAKRPLYHLQAGELGSDSLTVKRTLEKAFKLCAEWDCVLLLDGKHSHLFPKTPANSLARSGCPHTISKAKFRYPRRLMLW